jgi:hypothetical protein
VNLKRRRVLGAAVYSLAALALPTEDWWRRWPAPAGPGLRPMTGASGALMSRPPRTWSACSPPVDQRRGGGHARTAVVQYLTSDVAQHLRAPRTTSQQPLSATANLAVSSRPFSRLAARMSAPPPNRAGEVLAGRPGRRYGVEHAAPLDLRRGEQGPTVVVQNDEDQEHGLSRGDELGSIAVGRLSRAAAQTVSPGCRTAPAGWPADFRRRELHTEPRPAAGLKRSRPGQVRERPPSTASRAPLT